jgi:hypothetical protein
MTWLESIGAIEEYEDVVLDAALVADLERHAAGAAPRPIRFSTPTFKDYASTELKGCSKNSFPSFSITAGACGLNCDHCRAEILKPMLAARRRRCSTRECATWSRRRTCRVSCCRVARIAATRFPTSATTRSSNG